MPGILFLSNRTDNVVHCWWQCVNCDVEGTFSQRCVQKLDSTRMDTRDTVYMEGCVGNRDCERSKGPTELLFHVPMLSLCTLMIRLWYWYCNRSVLFIANYTCRKIPRKHPLRSSAHYKHFQNLGTLDRTDECPSIWLQIPTTWLQKRLNEPCLDLGAAIMLEWVQVAGISITLITKRRGGGGRLFWKGGTEASYHQSLPWCHLPQMRLLQSRFINTSLFEVPQACSNLCQYLAYICRR